MICRLYFIFYFCEAKDSKWTERYPDKSVVELLTISDYERYVHHLVLFCFVYDILKNFFVVFLLLTKKRALSQNLVLVASLMMNIKKL